MGNEQRIWAICKEAGASLYDTTEPTTKYADVAARLLFGTAAQESGLVWERQRSPSYWGNVGGFSKWQLEPASVQQSLVTLMRKPALARRATAFLFADPNATPAEWLHEDPRTILWAMRLDDNDRIGVLFARLHYFRVSNPIPGSVEEQAAYWKKYYNTSAGKGTVWEYVASWERYCRATVEG